MDRLKNCRSKSTKWKVPYLVPLNCSQIFSIILLITCFAISSRECRATTDIEPSTTSLYDFYLDRFSDFIDSTNGSEKLANANSRSTPPITRIGTQKSFTLNENDHEHELQVGIQPSRVYHRASQLDTGSSKFHEPRSDLFSPVFYLNSITPEQVNQYGSYSDTSDSLYFQNDAGADSSSYSDLIDSGSGNFENPMPGSEDGTNPPPEESMIYPIGSGSGYDLQNSIAPTPMQSQPSPRGSTPMPGDTMPGENQPPYLNRRLPRLTVTAGQVWRYFIPADTFVDEEDGDLKRLRSAIVRRESLAVKNLTSSSPSNSSSSGDSLDVAQYYSWVQYDASSQLLYGLPTESDVGRHELTLVVGDRFGATSQENIEIHVRQHQSSRAFTHQFKINDIQWEPEKFPSMVDALGELVKQISTRVFMDKAFENFILQRYSINDQANGSSVGGQEGGSSRRQQIMSFNLAWSNSSIPIQPCSTSQIENLFKPMVNTQYLRPDWTSALDSANYKLPPSASMLRILEPDFKPDSVSVSLMGSCDSRELFKNSTTTAIVTADNSQSTPEVRVKIGTLSWKLGQPVEYRVPVETFGSDQGAYTTRDLQLSLHTIDGLPLDKDPSYDFMEFDQEAQIIYALPVDQENHSGQRELLMTARHPKSGYKAREVIIVNIEPQDLTTINNRAFQMSLYFHTRIAYFDAQEKVSLSHKIVAATGAGADPLNRNLMTSSRRIEQITVMGISKSINRAQLMQPTQVLPGEAGVEYVDITRLERGARSEMLLENSLREIIYKYTWTNESIGSSGDCPVEVIKENILYSLEQSMLELRPPTTATTMATDSGGQQDQNKSDSTRFFERLRQYFEPELDLIHLRFEPLGACISAMELHDVGNSDLADMIDRASELDIELSQDQSLLSQPVSGISLGGSSSPKGLGAAARDNNDQASNEEYWSIVVLLILVVTLIFVIIVFFMGMHTYKINQDKRFEMQVKLAQARQNSMYLSSMILANLASPNDCGSASMPSARNAMCAIEDEEKSSRKPVILGNEKHLFGADSQNGGGGSLAAVRSMAVQLEGSSVRTTPVKMNSVLTLDSIATNNVATTGGSWQPIVGQLSMSPSALLYTPAGQIMDNSKRSTMTLNRRASAQRQQAMQFPANALNHSQSIITVASLATPLPVIPQGLVYTPVVPVITAPGGQPTLYNGYASLQRQIHHQNRASPAHMIAINPTNQQQHFMNNEQQQQPQIPAQQPNGIEPAAYQQQQQQHQQQDFTRMKSSSRSSSVSATTNSVISNPNYSPHR